MPAYIVFPDRTLIDMARRRPRSEAEFAEVNGVGAAKLEQFAGPFLAAIDAVLSEGDTGAAVVANEPAPVPTREPSAGRPSTQEPAPDGKEAALLAALKALRLELARERGVPAYVVFWDRTLIDMARRGRRAARRSSPR